VRRRPRSGQLVEAGCRRAGEVAQLLGLFALAALPAGQLHGTGWDRQGYHIDGCIQWLTGTKEGSDLHDVWKNVGALGDDIEIIQLDNFGTYEFEGVSITLWQDLDRLQSDLLAISPADSAEIKKLIKDVRAVQSMDMPAKVPVDMLPIGELLKLGYAMRSAGGVMSKSGKMTGAEYAERFQHPALKKMFTMGMPEGYSFAAFIFSLGIFSSGSGAIPRGGSKVWRFAWKNAI
jgi:phytoene dehydrogenase-like protein